MAALTIQKITKDGITPSYAVATATGDTFINDDRTFLQVKNTDAAGRTVTINPIVTSIHIPGFGDITIPAIAVSVPATTGDKMISVPVASYSASGVVTVTYSAVAGVTVGAFRVPKA